MIKATRRLWFANPTPRKMLTPEIPRLVSSHLDRRVFLGDAREATSASTFAPVTGLGATEPVSNGAWSSIIGEMMSRLAAPSLKATRLSQYAGAPTYSSCKGNVGVASPGMRARFSRSAGSTSSASSITRSRRISPGTGCPRSCRPWTICFERSSLPPLICILLTRR